MVCYKRKLVDFQNNLNDRFLSKRGINEKNFDMEMRIRFREMVSEANKTAQIIDARRKKKVEEWMKKEEVDEYSLSYQISYPMLIDYFKCLRWMSKDCFARGVFMVYGWMPTTLRFNMGCLLEEDGYSEIRKFLLDLQRIDVASNLDLLVDEKSVKFFERLKEIANNSVVGMSKLLHFVNPDIFPIYDSKIGDLVGKFDDVREYVSYVRWFNGLCGAFDEGVSRFMDCEEISDFKKRFGYSENFVLSTIRLVELTLFQYSKSSDFKGVLENEEKQRAKKKSL